VLIANDSDKVEFFAPVRSREARLDRYLRNREIPDPSISLLFHAQKAPCTSRFLYSWTKIPLRSYNFWLVCKFECPKFKGDIYAYGSCHSAGSGPCEVGSRLPDHLKREPKEIIARIRIVDEKHSAAVRLAAHGLRAQSLRR
jgi:hypothetical protein